MSGGSFNYLFLADSEELLKREGDLDAMRLALRSLQVQDAAELIDALIAAITHYRAETEALMDKLSTPMKEVEWLYSGDTGEYLFEKRIEDWRKYFAKES